MITIREGVIDEVPDIIGQISELTPTHDGYHYSDRIGDRFYLLLIAEDDGHTVGFKLGFEEDRTTFYSWLGGVLPSYRGKGIAKQLLFRQEEIIFGKGYQKISVKSMNRFTNMMKMLISNRYLIVGYDDQGNPQDSKILFSKSVA